jgi:hypothetical protein
VQFIEESEPEKRSSETKEIHPSPVVRSRRLQQSSSNEELTQAQQNYAQLQRVLQMASKLDAKPKQISSEQLADIQKFLKVKEKRKKSTKSLIPEKP